MDAVKGIVEGLVEELIPIDFHEFKIISWKLFAHTNAKQTQSGYIQTIFQEQLFAYALRVYSSGAVACVASSESTYQFDIRKDKTKVFLSDELKGTIKEENSFIVMDIGKELYEVTFTDSSNAIITKDQKQLAQIYLGNGNTYSDSDRLFTMLYQISEQEQSAMVILVLYILMKKLIND